MLGPSRRLRWWNAILRFGLLRSGWDGLVRWREVAWWDCAPLRGRSLLCGGACALLGRRRASSWRWRFGSHLRVSLLHGLDRTGLNGCDGRTAFCGLSRPASKFRDASGTEILISFYRVRFI